MSSTDLEQHLVASGRVRVVTRVAVAAQTSKRVVAVPAAEGMRVAAGDLLVQLDDEQARVEVARAAVARVDVDEARRDVEIARARRAAAAAEEAGTMPEGAGSRVAMSALVESEARFAAAQTRLEQTRVRARHDGIVLARLVEPGDTAAAGATLVEMAADPGPVHRLGTKRE